MISVRLALLLAVYVSLDFANPLMPGAVGFGALESVEARQADRLRGADVVASPPLAPNPDQVAAVEPPVLRTIGPASPPIRHVCFRRSYPTRSSLAASSEDA